MLLHPMIKEKMHLQENKLFDLDLGVKSEIMYFLVNASSKRLDVATSNFADTLVSSKAGICDGVPSTEV